MLVTPYMKDLSKVLECKIKTVTAFHCIMQYTTKQHNKTQLDSTQKVMKQYIINTNNRYQRTKNILHLWTQICFVIFRYGQISQIGEVFRKSQNTFFKRFFSFMCLCANTYYIQLVNK